MEYSKYYIEDAFTIQYLVTCFESTFEKTYSCPGERHDFWEMVYVADGALGVTADDRILELAKGQVIFHKPMEFHRLWSLKDTAPHAVIMSFGATGEGMRYFEDGVFYLGQKEEAYLWHILKQASRLTDGMTVKGNPQAPHAGQIIRCNLELLLLSIQLHDQPVTVTPTSNKAVLYHDIIEYMQDHMHTKCTLDEIARGCNVSAGTVKNVLRRYTGESPISYLNHMRLNEAKRMLANGFSMYETSDALGFSSQNYFSAFFKKLTGMTPSEYAGRFRKGGRP